MIFDPFESRLCRDIRNNLGCGFVKSVQQGTLAPFESALNNYQADVDRPPFNAYINHRFILLKKILRQMDSDPLKPTNEFSILMLFWNHQLYYEFHEWIEEIWLTAKGDYKKSLQALIFASVAFEQHHYNRPSPAKKLSIKAIAKLDKYGSSLPDNINSKVFIGALKKI